MKYKLRYTKKFKKDLRRIQKQSRDIAKMQAIVERLANGKELEAKYRNHLLSGKWVGHYECHIEPDWLLIYFKKDDTLVLTLVRTGTHSDLF